MQRILAEIKVKNNMRKQKLMRKQVLVAVMVGMVVVALGFSSQAWGQAEAPVVPRNPPLTLAQATISPTMAKRTMFPNIINADTARALVDSCVNWVKAHPSAVTMDIVVLSPTGQIIDAHGLDGLMPIGQEATLAKARTVLFTRAPTGNLEKQLNAPTGVKALLERRDFGKDLGFDYFGVSGAFPIIVEGQMIGVMSAGGAAGGGELHADTICPYQALQKVIGPQPPLPDTGGTH